MPTTDEYLLPLGIDATGFVSELRQIKAAVTELQAVARQSGAVIQETFTTAGAASNKVVVETIKATTAIKDEGAAAKATATQFTTMLDSLLKVSSQNTKSFSADQLAKFNTTLKDTRNQLLSIATEQTNAFDKSKIAALGFELQSAKDDFQQLNLIIDFVQKNLGDLKLNPAATQGLESSITSLKTLFAQVGDAGSGSFKKIGDSEDQFEVKTQKITTRIRAITNELAGLKEGDPRIIALTTEAGELQNRLDDARQSVRLLASDTTTLDAGIQAVQGIVGAFAAAQGAIALFGDQNEELQKTLLKVNAAMSLLQGIQQIGQLLDKNSALNIFLLKTFRLQDAAAAQAQTIAQEEYNAALIEQAVLTGGLTEEQARLAVADIALAGAEGTATVAQEGLNAAMLSNPAGILLLAIGALVGAFVLLSNITDDVITKEELLTKAQKDVGDGLSQQQAKILPYLLATKNLNNSESERIEIYNRLKEINPDIVKGLTAQTITYELLKQNVDAYLDSLREQIALEANTSAIQGSIQQENILKQRIALLNQQREAAEAAVKYAADAEAKGIAQFNVQEIATNIKATTAALKQQEEITKDIADSGAKIVTGNAKVVEQTNKQLIDSAKSLDDLNNVIKKIQDDYNNATDDAQRKRLNADLQYGETRKKVLDISQFTKDQNKQQGDYLKSQESFQQALEQLQNKFRQISFSLLPSDREKAKAEAEAAAKDQLEAIDKLIIKQKADANISKDQLIELDKAASDARTAISKELNNKLLGIDKDFYKQQQDLIESANAAIAGITKNQTDLQIEAASKEFDDLINKLEEQNNKILSQKTITPVDLTAIQQNNTKILQLEKAKDAAIIKIRQASSLEQLEIQKKLAEDTIDTLHIEGLSEEELTKLKEQKKLQIEKEFAEKERDLLKDNLEKQGVLTKQQLDDLFDPKNLRHAQEKNEDIFTFLGINIDDPEVKKKVEELIELLNKLRNVGAEGNAKSKERFSLLKFIGLDPNDPDQQAALNGMQDLWDGLTKIAEDGAQKQIDAIQSVIDATQDQIDTQQDIVDRQKELSDKGLANDLANQQKALDDLKLKKQEEIKQREEAQKNLEQIRKREAIVQAASIAASTIETEVNMIKAASEAFANYTKIPIVGIVLAIGAVATLLSAFVRIKAAFRAATSDVPAIHRHGGGEDLAAIHLHGPSHEEKGFGLFNNKTGQEVAQYEGDEYLFAVNKQSTKKYLPLLEAINQDNLPVSNTKYLKSILGEESARLPMDKIEQIIILQREVESKQIEQVGTKIETAIRDIHKTINGIQGAQKVYEDHGSFFLIKEAGRVRKVWKKIH